MPSEVSLTSMPLAASRLATRTLAAAVLAAVAASATAPGAGPVQPPWELFLQSGDSHSKQLRGKAPVALTKGRAVALLATDEDRVANVSERELQWRHREKAWEETRGKLERNQEQMLADMSRLEGAFETVRSQQADLQQRSAKESRLLRAFSSSAEKALGLEHEAEAEVKFTRRAAAGAVALSFAIAVAWISGVQFSMKGSGAASAPRLPLSALQSGAVPECTAHFGAGSQCGEVDLPQGPLAAEEEEACAPEASPPASCSAVAEDGLLSDGSGGAGGAAAADANEEDPAPAACRIVLWKEPDLPAAGAAAPSCQYFRLDGGEERA